MSVRLRLQRRGSKKSPFYRVVAADRRAPRDGRYIEQLGVFHPLVESDKVLNLDLERVDYWLSTGAKPSDRVASLIRYARSGEVKTITEYEADQREANKLQRESALKGVAVPQPTPVKAEEEASAKDADAPAEEAESTDEAAESAEADAPETE